MQRRETQLDRDRRERTAKLRKKRQHQATLGMLCLIGALVLLIVFLYVNRATSEDSPYMDKPWLNPDSAPVLVFDEHCCTCDDCEQNGCPVEHVDRSEAEVSQERMVKEVSLLWTMWFDDEGASPDDSRRQRFDEFAEYLVDAVLLYQREQTDIGGQLPGHKNDHLVVAFMAAKESSITYDAVGRSNDERGLLQVHGRALAGYDPDKVQNNPQLGLLLGVRWIATQIPQCPAPSDEWTDHDWVGPLSVYAGGPRGKRKDGTCKKFQTMRERIDKVRMYRVRIDREMDNWEE